MGGSQNHAARRGTLGKGEVYPSATKTELRPHLDR